MRTVYYLIALALVIFVSKLVFVNKAEAGGPWSDQYCDVEVTQIKIIDQNGDVIESKTEEKLVCQDGVKDFLHGMGIADSCQMFNWNMPVGEVLITQRQIACHKMNGEYEIVQGYHSID
jgi:hypothetical protein|tara:strand:+ start:311 stop:667 length:357 start_codon:yes stop_codon:yes gene_type:complete